MRIYFERTGGFAGMRVTATVDTDSLPSDDARELGELVDASGFFDILAGSTSSPGRADRFQYKLTIEDGERQHTAEINESAAPDSIRPLLRRLTTLARGQ